MIVDVIDHLAGIAPGLVAAVEAEIEAGHTTGPYGVYPGGGVLAAESDEGLRYRVTGVPELGERLAAAFEHAHLLVFRPREARQDDLDALARAGWSATGIVTLSQLVAFLSFQVRLVTGLRLLNQEGLAA
ncbi:CMD domain protein [Nonomuraea sp. NPDC050643]|uniref:CMD domain protein n=1 Tax=Nonomuraea sp. NPDC050643 TaxID=3155660 RepID=UPI0033F1AECA